MQLTEWLFGLYNGLATGMTIFLVAAGLTWIFGILRILNMAHGHFFMIGVYVAFSIIGQRPDSFGTYLLGALAAGASVAALGYLTDRVLLQRLRQFDYHYVLIGTFALLLCIEGAVRLLWGGQVSTVDPPPQLAGAVQVGELFIPKFTIFVISVGAAVFLVLDHLLQRTWIGKLMQSVASDPWMAGMLGVNVPALLRASVIASFALAGAAGGLLVPLQTVDLTIGGSYLLLAFFAVIIGGLGSVRGAFAASLLLGLVQNLGNLLLPDLPGFSIYIALAAFLVGWPNGIVPPRDLRT
jgi:branched-subunit amino acid ABC-type transport system permease component